MSDHFIYDVVLLTEDRYEAPNKISPYIANVLKEDKLVSDALEKLGLKVGRMSWSNANFDWSSTKVALFRTTWDYFYRFDEFEEWLNKVKSVTKLIHSAKLINWNLSKTYLRDLEAEGIRIPPTAIIPQKSKDSLQNYFAHFESERLVMKPCVSGCARHTYVISTDNWTKYEEIFQELLLNEDMMIQPFLNSITKKGEVAHMVIGGKYSHSILKLAKKGDFRVQDDFGGSTQEYIANEEEKKFVEKAVKACKYSSVYGRVDVVWDNDGELAVSEIEMIEPEMWFRYCPEAAHKLAEEIIKEIN